MSKISNENKPICVIGLGYVGLPLLLAFGEHFSVIGYDVDQSRIDELNQSTDRNHTYSRHDFESKRIIFTSNIDDIKQAIIYIVAVPTPITKQKTPDLTLLKSATKTVALCLQKNDMVVFESTVYPGCTTEVCIPILEDISKLKTPVDFKVAYSPERINPGDKIHTIKNTIKVVSGIDDETVEAVSQLYSSIISAGVHRAPSIKVAEAAKIIENVQRDLNIALMNELALIFNKMDINTHDVIEVAATKWNFHKYYPGLVGGHCISVDPYYLTYKAQELGYFPDVILSGRKVNDHFSRFISSKVVQFLSGLNDTLSSSRVLVMGITFKENVSDVRESKVVELVKDLLKYHIQVDIVDPHASTQEVMKNYNLELKDKIALNYDCIILAVKHQEYLEFDEVHFFNLLGKQGLLIDVKGIYKGQFSKFEYWLP
jgi:UDP-N-acetyl-D-galactosamine dehydrogenase